MATQPSCDAVIVGAGSAGLSLALALAHAGRRVTVVDAAPAPVTPPDAPDQWEPRVLALSPASVGFLRGCGIGALFDGPRAGVIGRMRVRGDDGASLEFSAWDAGLDALAHIVEVGRLQHALLRAAQAEPAITLRHGLAPGRLVAADTHVDLVLASGESLRSPLLVGADGVGSWTRDSAGLRATRKPYGQTGVVASFECELEHRDIARQWFRRESGGGVGAQGSVLAWLPLPGRRMSMVWSAPEEQARALMQMEPAALEAEVARAGGNELGRLRLIGRAAAFPLVLMGVDHLVAPRVALVGDAAHVVHPLAGQGANLGFGDAQQLAACLAGEADAGSRRVLRAYERARAGDILAMKAATDGLVRLFSSPSAVVARLRNTGMNLFDRVPLLKTVATRHAAGTALW